MITASSINNVSFTNSSQELKNELLKKIDAGIPEWMTNQINQDFAHAPVTGITLEMIEQTMDQDPEFIVKFIIKDGKITTNTRPEMNRQDYYGTLYNALNELNSYITLPDAVFLYNVDDAPGNYANLISYTMPPVSLSHYRSPVFAPTKHRDDKNVVAIPDPHTLGRMDSMYKEVKMGNSTYPWESKISKAFWRGATTGGFYFPENYTIFPRTKLVELSLKNAGLLDAKFNHVVDYWGGYITSLLKELGYTGKSLDISEHMRYKYQILIDGNSASWTRCYWQLHANSVIFKQNSPYVQWYYGLLKPYVNYIPFDYFCEDLIERIQWAQNNDLKVQEIVKNANLIAESSLKYSDMLLYLYEVITSYAKLQAFNL